jgi:hypothetical protein
LIGAQGDPEAAARQGPDDRHRLPIVPEDQDAIAFA